MAERYWRKFALRSKVESSYGTDPTPTGTDNAILAVDATHTPLEGEELSRDFLFPYLGHQGVVLAGLYARLEFGVEIAGAGDAGDVPQYGPLLRASGFAQTVTADTKVDYDLVSAAQESATHWYDRDGVKQVLLGSRSNLTMELVPRQIPRFRFPVLGLLGTAVDSALPVVTLTPSRAVPVSKANTTLTLHGVTVPTERISIDLGNQVEPRMLIGHESIQIVDRRASGSVVLQAGLLADKDWDAIAKAGTTGAMTITHGTVAGNIVEITAPKVQIGRRSEGQTQGIVNNTLPLMFLPSAGNDEIKITVK